MKAGVRFKIFERDNFTCQYCGRKPPEVILHCDHIHPVSKGGDDAEINLITSCRDCNLGKKAKILKNPKRVDVKQEIENLEEAEKQIKEYYKHLKKLAGYKEKNPVIDLICEVWETESEGVNFIAEKGKHSLKLLLKKYLAEDIIEAVKICWDNSRIANESKWQYMCGVLKNLKLKRDNPELAKKNEEIRKTYNRLLLHWKNQGRGSGYLRDYEVKKWLESWTEDEIKIAMDSANGIWSDLKIQFE